MGGSIIGMFGAAFAYSHGTYEIALAFATLGFALAILILSSEPLYAAVAKLELTNGRLVRRGFPFPLKRLDSWRIAGIRRVGLVITIAGRSTVPSWIALDKSGSGLFWLSAEQWDVATMEELASAVGASFTATSTDLVQFRDAQGNILPRW